MAGKSVRLKRGASLKIGSAAAAAIVAEVLTSLPAHAKKSTSPINMTCFSSAGRKKNKVASQSVKVYLWEGITPPPDMKVPAPGASGVTFLFDNRGANAPGAVDFDLQCHCGHEPKPSDGISLVVTT